MKRQHLILLIMAMFIVAVLLIYDYKHDYSPYHMTAGEQAVEILLCSAIYVPVFYFVLYGMYRAFSFFISK